MLIRKARSVAFASSSELGEDALVKHGVPSGIGVYAHMSSQDVLFLFLLLFFVFVFCCLEMVVTFPLRMSSNIRWVSSPASSF